MDMWITVSVTDNGAGQVTVLAGNEQSGEWHQIERDFGVDNAEDTVDWVLDATKRAIQQVIV